MYSLTRHLSHRLLASHRFAQALRAGHRPRLNGFSALSVNYLLMQLAVEMVGSFGVLFVWQLGRNVREGLLLILLLFGFQRIIVGLSLLPVGNLYARVGHRWMMAAAQLALIAKLFLLSHVVASSGQSVNYPTLLVAFALGGFYIATYYVGFHSLFLFDTIEKNVGKGIGLIDMLGRFSGVIAPLLAGLLVDRFDFSVMFTVAMFFLAFSSIPLFLMRHAHIPVKPSSGSLVLRLIKAEPRFALSIFWWHTEDAIGGFFWPVFLILIVKNYAVFGVIGSAVMIASSVMVYFSGYIYDKQPLRRVFPGASAAIGVMWVVRFLSRTPLTAGAADVLYRLISPIWWMKIRREELVVGERADRMDFAIAHELMVTLGTLSGLVIGYSLLVVGNLNWYWLLIPALAGLFMSTKAIQNT